MDVFAAYKPTRNKISLLERDDALRVIWAYCQYLQLEDFKIPPDIEVDQRFFGLDVKRKWIAEWTLELLTKEVLLNSGGVAKKGQTFRTWKTLSGILNAIRDLEHEIYGKLGAKNILVEMLRIAHRQFIWQSNNPNRGMIIRYYKIYNDPIIDQIAINRIGLSIREIYLCALTLMGHLLDSPTVPLPLTSSIKELPAEKFNSFFSFTSKTLKEIQAILKSEQKFNVDYAYAYNSLRAYPVIRTLGAKGEAAVCPLPTLLFWRIAGGLYYELINDPQFANAFGNAIQKYVGEVLEAASSSKSDLTIVGEEEYVVGKNKKKSIDWIAADKTAALFIECKAKRLSWVAKVSLHDLTALEADIESMASAVVQTYKTIQDCRSGAYASFKLIEGQRVYPTIVTLENWHMFGPIMMEGLADAVMSKLKNEGLSSELVTEMPYSIWALEEIELGIQIMNEVPIHEFMNGKLGDDEMRKWEWMPYMTNKFPKFQAQELFESEFEKLGAGLT